MSPRLLVLAILCGACRDAPVELRYAPAPGTVLERLVESELQMELGEFEYAIDGEPQPGMARLQRQLLLSFLPGGVETWDLVDRIVHVEDGRPAEILRTIVRLRSDQGLTAGWTEALDGSAHTLRRADGRIEEAGRSVPFDLDLCTLLPAEPVRRGDTWRVPLASVELLEELELGSGDLEVECTYAGTSRGPSGALARIEVRLEHEARADDPADALLDQGTQTPAPDEFLEIATIELNGQLLWDSDRGHAVEFTASAELAIETSALARGAVGGRERTVETGTTITVRQRLAETIAVAGR